MSLFLIGEEKEPTTDDSFFEDMEEMEKRGFSERWDFWHEEFDRCIKCYACRNACPLCYCNICIVDKNQPQWISPCQHGQGNLSWNIIRAMHLGGRCVGCGACERACPMNIKIGLLNQKLVKVVKDSFGYRAGMDPEAPMLVATYNVDERKVNQSRIVWLMVDKIISKQNLEKLPAWLVEAGFRVIAPKKGAGTMLFGEISSYEAYDEDCLKPERSIKEMFFPRTEKIFKYRHTGKGKVQLKENEDFAPKTVLFGVRPCDAASLPIMDKVFRWDYLDNYYLKRREETCLISISCERCDEFCLCTTLGLSPTSENGSDILLLKLDETSFYARVITPKGEEICSQAEALFEATSDEAPEGFAGPEIKADLEQINPWLDGNFENEIWDELGLRCLGCGSCTYRLWALYATCFRA
jgi:ferredoxin